MILFNFQRFLSRFLEIYGMYLPLFAFQRDNCELIMLRLS